MKQKRVDKSKVDKSREKRGEEMKRKVFLNENRLFDAFKVMMRDGMDEEIV